MKDEIREAFEKENKGMLELIPTYPKVQEEYMAFSQGYKSAQAKAQEEIEQAIKLLREVKISVECYYEISTALKTLIDDFLESKEQEK